jgi:DNA (cytosine-5)-methyltransferase 1
MPYKVIDLFAGAGGMTLGFSDPRFCGGFEPILSIDNDKAATETHARNFDEDTVCLGDIEQWILRNEVPEADVVIGGPPCQGFSLLNKQRVGDRRRELWEPFLDVVRLSRSRVFVMENVGELFNSNELLAIKRRAKRLGYEIKAEILNAADYGVPQTRKRTIVVGWKIDLVCEPRFPPPTTHADPSLNMNFYVLSSVLDLI